MVWDTIYFYAYPRLFLIQAIFDCCHISLFTLIKHSTTEQIVVKSLSWTTVAGGLDSLFQKTPIITAQKNEPLSKVMHLKTAISSQGLKLSNSKPGCSQLFTFSAKQKPSDIELNQIRAFSASYSRINPSFTDEIESEFEIFTQLADTIVKMFFEHLNELLTSCTKKNL
jgi:hypothetical protein